MNCRNCGMPLTGSKCEYCGTDYSAELGLVLIAKQAPPLNDTTLTTSSVWRWNV